MDSTACTTIAIKYKFDAVYDGNGVINGIKFVPFNEDHTTSTVNESIAVDECIDYEDDLEYLHTLDPKEWKSQDHYKVLGIPKLRYNASDEVIKKAYRRKVLKHHPDKRKSLGEQIQTDDYFTCITVAYEILGNPIKRRSYDSVDPQFDNSLPTTTDINSKEFYTLFSYYFQLNSRWSEHKSTPMLGDASSARDHVENFYAFWYDFKSWREYSYEDEEDKSKCQDREERRYVEKLNKVERIRKKKDEMLRIRQLVDLSYNNDPRVARFKSEDRERKLAQKRAKQTLAQAKREEEERTLKEIQRAQEKAEEAEQARLKSIRLEREAHKKSLKKERKSLRDVCKTNNYYSENPDECLIHMEQVEFACEHFTISELEELNKQLRDDDVDTEAIFRKVIKENHYRIEMERKRNDELVKSSSNKYDAKENMTNEWNEDNIMLLVKAVNIFPAGTNQRWDIIAKFINQHGIFKIGNSNGFSAKAVLAKAKDLQSMDFSKSNLKDAANKMVFENLHKSKRNIVVNADGTSTMTPLTNGDSSIMCKENEKIWTAIEQQLLEQALKTYPPSSYGSDRWDRIAACIPNRNKNDCIKRYKELVEIVKAKRAAQSAVNSKS